ncbi:MAG: ACT domain-containing protein [Clostridia bacterium]|nr:ACT domain-containing protein [Clostridia bacterium]
MYNIIILPFELSVCKVTDYSKVKINEFTFIAKTDEENSLVCPTPSVPQNITHREDGWKAFRIEGELDFSLVGVLAKISTLLANNGIGIFAISTYNTDYILTKDMDKAADILRSSGYNVT